MIITRYKAAKLVGIQESVFSQMWKRQNNGSDFYDFFTPEGKVDINSPGFEAKYISKIDHQYLDKLIEKSQPKEPIEKNKDPEPIAPPKKRGRPKKEKSIIESSETKKSNRVHVPKKQIEEQEEQENDEDKELRELTREATKAEKRKKITDAEKSAVELKKARALLVEIETLGETCMGYLSALNQNIMEMPTGFIDEFDAATKTKKSRSDRLDILRLPICEAIGETKEQIIKELEKARRVAKAYERKHKK